MAELFWPFDTSLVSEWPGSSVGRPEAHMGTDFAVPQGTPLLATSTGRVVRHGINANGYGLDIITDDGLVVRNWHLSRMDVNTGDRVAVGQTIGLTGGAAGSEGAGFSTGPHLHWEIRTNQNFSQNGWLDPRTLNPQTFGQTPLEDDMSKSLYYSATSNSPSGVVKKGEWWVRTLPGEPLRRVTQGQASDYFALEGLDFNAPNVFSKEGSWFDLAFAEDNEVFAQSAKAHPWMASTGGSSVDPKAIAKAVNDDAAKRMVS